MKMTNRLNGIETLENRQLFAFTGGFVMPQMQFANAYASDIALVVSFIRPGAMFSPHFNAPWGGHHERNSTPTTDSSASTPSTSTGTDSSSSDAISTLSVNANSSTSTTENVIDAASQSSQTTTATIDEAGTKNNDDDSTVPETQTRAEAGKSIAITGSAQAASRVPVRVLTDPRFQAFDVTRREAGTVVAEDLSATLLANLAKAVIAGQKVMAASVLAQLQSPVVNNAPVHEPMQQPVVAEQEAKPATVNEPAKEESNVPVAEETPMTLAAVQPVQITSHSLLYRMAIGVSAFIVIGYAWTRRMSRRMLSVNNQNRDGMTRFER